MAPTTRTPKQWSSEAVTSSNLNRGPGGWVGFDATSADITGITGTPVTILSIPFEVGTSRRLKVSTAGAGISSVVADLVTVDILYDGARQSRQSTQILSVGGPGTQPIADLWISASGVTGAHTITIQALLGAGTGPCTIRSGFSCIIEDVGSVA